MFSGMSITTAAEGRYRDAFAIREFRAIFVSHVITMAGTVVAELALTVLVYDRSKSPLLAALVFALAFMPYLLTGTLLSALVDRLPTRRLMVICSLLSAVVAALMGVPWMPVPVLLGLAFTLGLIAPAFAGTRAATLAEVLSAAAYPPGRSLMRIVTQMAQVGGFAVGGLLLVVVSPAGALLLNAGCFAVSAVVLRFGTRERPPSTDAHPPLLRDSLSGLKQVLGIVALRKVLLLGWLVPMLGATPEALVIPYADGLGANSVQKGLLMGAMPIGFVLSEVLLTWRARPETQVRLVPALSILPFLPLLGYAMRPDLTFTFVFLLISGTGGAHHIGLDRLFLHVAPEHLRSQALSIQAAGLMFWQGVGFTLAGAAAEFIPIHLVVLIAAITGLVTAAVYARGLPRIAEVASL